jgi:cupin fold WbuC family metalloprotein
MQLSGEEMKIIDDQLLNDISKQASESQRLRMNYNLHASLEDKVQRLLNALEPGTELPVHRHKHTDETYVLLRGKLDVKIYDDHRKLIQVLRLDMLEGKYGVSIPANHWHTIEVLEKGTVILELKEGPYQPLQDDDILK